MNTQLTKVRNQVEHDGFMTPLKVTRLLGRKEYEARAVRDLLVKHTPLISMKAGENEILMDARQFLQGLFINPSFQCLIHKNILDPALMVELWKSQPCFQDSDQNQEVPTVPVRKEGSGRPSGSYLLSNDVTEAVKDLIEHAGLPGNII